MWSTESPKRQASRLLKGSSIRLILPQTTKSYTFLPTLLYNQGMAKGKLLMLRVDEEQHGQFTRAAKAAGKTASAWLRDLGAREIAPPTTTLTAHSGPPLVAGSMPVPALQGGAILHVEAERGQRRKTAAELVDSIPGVRLGGFGGIDMATNPQEALDSANALIDKWAQEPYYVGNAPVEEITTKPWLPLWTKLVQKINDDPDSFYEEVNRLCPGFKPTQAFWKLPIERQAAALDEKYPLEAE